MLQDVVKSWQLWPIMCVFCMQGCLRHCNSRWRPRHYDCEPRLKLSDPCNILPNPPVSWYAVTPLQTPKSFVGLLYVPIYVIPSILHLRQGMLKALQFALRLIPNGLACLGPPCSSWCWVNMATSGRSSIDPTGDESARYVQVANKNPSSHNYQPVICACSLNRQKCRSSLSVFVH